MFGDTKITYEDLLHLYAMLALPPRKFETRAQKDFYIKTYRTQTPMFYVADFEVALDIEKLLQSKDSDHISKEEKEEILKEFNNFKYDNLSEYTTVRIKISNDPHIKQNRYERNEKFIRFLADANDNKIILPCFGNGYSWDDTHKRFNFQKWINLEMYYQRYLQWIEDEDIKRIPPWHNHEKENAEWEGWKIIHVKDSEHVFRDFWFFENDYIRIYPSLIVWDRWGRTMDECELESELPPPVSEEE